MKPTRVKVLIVTEDGELLNQIVVVDRDLNSSEVEVSNKLEDLIERKFETEEVETDA